MLNNATLHCILSTHIKTITHHNAPPHTTTPPYSEYNVLWSQIVITAPQTVTEMRRKLHAQNCCRPHYYVRMYVCTYVCMYVYMYVRMYVCTYVCVGHNETRRLSPRDVSIFVSVYFAIYYTNITQPMCSVCACVIGSLCILL